MKINDKIRDEKLLKEINKEAAKISTFSSGKIDKYEYLTGDDQKRVIELAKLTHSPLGKALEKQTKSIEEQGQK